MTENDCKNIVSSITSVMINCFPCYEYIVPHMTVLAVTQVCNWYVCNKLCLLIWFHYWPARWLLSTCSLHSLCILCLLHTPTLPTPGLNSQPPSPKSPTHRVHPTSPVRDITMQQGSPNSDQSDSPNHQNHQIANYKKPRTQYTPHQLLYLQERFLENHFPSIKAKENMAKELELKPYHVQVKPLAPRLYTLLS